MVNSMFPFTVESVVCLFTADHNTVLVFDFHNHSPGHIHRGSIIRDLSFNGNDGIWHGRPRDLSADDNLNKGLYIDMYEQIEIPLSKSLTLQTNFTIEIWVHPLLENRYLHEEGTTYVMTWNDSFSFPGITTTKPSTTEMVWFWGKKKDASNASLWEWQFLHYTSEHHESFQNSTHYYALTCDDRFIKIYIDGLEMSAKSTTNTPFIKSQYGWVLGDTVHLWDNTKGFGKLGFEGFIFAVRISNATRSARAIWQSFIASK